MIDDLHFSQKQNFVGHHVVPEIVSIILKQFNGSDIMVVLSKNASKFFQRAMSDIFKGIQ